MSSFIAIPATDDLLRFMLHSGRHQLVTDINNHLPDPIRFRPSPDLHLTLRYLGTPNDATTWRFRSALTSLCQRQIPFHLSAHSLDVFPRSRPHPAHR